jgi:hypothetical protein
MQRLSIDPLLDTYSPLIAPDGRLLDGNVKVFERPLKGLLKAITRPLKGI